MVTADDDAPVLTLTGANGDELTLNGWGDGVGITAKTSGVFGLPPRDVRKRSGAGAGARWAGTRILERPIDLGVSITSSSAAQQRDRVARLAAICDDAAGPATLTVTVPSRGADAARMIDLHYTGGWEGDTSGSLLTYEQPSLSFVALDPFFRAAEPISTAFHTGGSARPFLSTTVPFFPVTLAPSQVLGQVTILNPGDVDTPAVWRILGPGGPVTISPTDADADGFTITGTLSQGDVLFVSEGTLTSPAPVGATDDVDHYDRFAPAPKLWQIPPGSSTARVAMTSATTDSEVLLTFWPKYRLGA